MFDASIQQIASLLRLLCMDSYIILQTGFVRSVVNLLDNLIAKISETEKYQVSFMEQKESHADHDAIYLYSLMKR